MPYLQELFNNNIRRIDNELLDFSDPLPNEAQLQSHTHAIIDRFFFECDGLLDGSSVSIDMEGDSGGILFRNNITEFHAFMDKITQLFDLPTEKIKQISKNKCGMEGVSYAFNSIVRSLLQKNLLMLKTTLYELLSKISATYSKFIRSVYNKELETYKNLKIVFYKKIEEIQDNNFLETQRNLSFLVDLECECIDPDLILIPILNERTPTVENLKSIIEQFFLTSKKALNEAAPKYIKHYFINKNLKETKTELHNYCECLIDIKSMYVEADENEKKRKALYTEQEGFRLVEKFVRDLGNELI